MNSLNTYSLDNPNRNFIRFFNVSDIISHSQKEKLNVIYIGKDSLNINLLSDNFDFGLKAEDLLEAQTFISSHHFYNNILPDFIFLDIPFVQAELERFSLFLKQQEVFYRTTIVYNENKVSKADKELIKKHNLVDDIIHISKTKINYEAKVLFMKRIKMMEHEKASVIRNYKRSLNITKPFFYIKRLIDILASLTALILLSPIFLLIIIAIKLESKGPVFYAAKRAGRGFRIFKFYKFRSMDVDADKKIKSLSHLNQYATKGSGPVFIKINNDPRVTKVGKFLRKTSLDEVPQFLNVLKGDMSLVGNRPLPLYEAVTLTTNEFVERFSAPAGITGWWQVKKRGKAEMSVEERVSLDISYSRNCNALFDFKIMAMTPLALFQKSDV